VSTGERRSVAAARRAGAGLRPALPALRIVAFTAAVSIVVFMCVRAAQDVKLDELSWWPLPFALAATTAWWVLLARGWSVLVTGHFARDDAATWCRTQTLRYLPGGVWAPASRATVLHGGWLDRISTVAAENVIALCAALAIGGAAIAASGAPLWLPLVIALAIPALGSRLVSDHTRLAPERTHRATLNYLIAFLGYAVAAMLVQTAVSGFTDPFEVAGVAAVAWAAGLVVVIAPGGVGVRELVYVALLSHAFPDGELAAAAVTLRGLTIVAELGVLLLVGRPQGAGEVVRRTVASGLALARRHALFLGLVAAGAALRLLAFLAYQPALLFYDSVDYLSRAANFEPGTTRPLGYSAFLRALPGDSLSSVPATQHLMGLAIGVMIYALLLRLGVRRWAAALAAAPVLLDAYQLIFEEFVLSETLFVFLLVAGCAALLWNRRPGIVEAGLAGALFAGVALTRANGLLVIGPALLAVLCLLWDPRRGRLRAALPALVPAAALVGAFAVPVAVYATSFHHFHGSYAITNTGGDFLYGRVAPFADCKKLSVPAHERILCPGQAVGHRPRLQGSTVNWYMWARFGDNTSPRFKVLAQPGGGELPARFARRAILAQPWDYFKAVSHDFLRGFAPIRTRHHDELPISRWQFSPEYPVYTKFTSQILRAHGDAPARSRPALGRFLRGYQRFGFTWGPVLALGMIAGLLAAIGVGRARRSGLRTATFLFAAMAVVTFGSTVAVNTFTWRYQIILVSLLPPAAALGLTAILRRPGESRSTEPPETASEESDRYPPPASLVGSREPHPPAGASSSEGTS
jgi:Dolichyl-phosphate-mannose-protein mannosyltransferase